MSTNYGSANTSYCRPTYATAMNKFQGYQIYGINRNGCTYGDKCRGAHAPSQLVKSSHITAWEKKNKSTINVLTMKNTIYSSLNEGATNVKSTKYKSKLSHISTMKFDELLSLWFEVACYHRKIIKELKTGSSISNGYSNIHDVPRFLLANEDDYWALERVLHMCPKHLNMISSKGTPISIKDICTGADNCKDGCHQYKDVVCIDNLLTGSCSCPPDTYIEDYKRLSAEIKAKCEQIDKINYIDEDGFEVVISKSLENTFKSEIAKLNAQLKALRPRKLHYTEDGLIPLSERIAEEEKSKPQDINVTELKTKSVKKIIKKIK